MKKEALHYKLSVKNVLMQNETVFNCTYPHASREKMSRQETLAIIWCEGISNQCCLRIVGLIASQTYPYFLGKATRYQSTGETRSEGYVHVYYFGGQFSAKNCYWNL